MDDTVLAEPHLATHVKTLPVAMAGIISAVLIKIEAQTRPNGSTKLAGPCRRT
jgi:hypothetical protein